MTTKSGASVARDQLLTHHGPGTDSQGTVQSAAVRGATRAFTARGHNQRPDVQHANVRNARAAAALAGYAARQKSISPPKTEPSAIAAPLRSQQASTSQVRQLVRGFEQSSAANKVQVPLDFLGTSEKVQSTSHSMVAARIASSSSPSSLRASVSSHDGSKGSGAVPDTDVCFPVNRFEPRSQFKATDSTRSTSGLLRRTSSVQTLPAMLVARQLCTDEQDQAASNTQKHTLESRSGTISAQADVNDCPPLDPDIESEPLETEASSSFDSRGVVSEDVDRGRKPNIHRRISERPFRSVPDSSTLNEPAPTANGREACSERSARNVLEPRASIRPSSPQPRYRFGSTSTAHYRDERTGLTEVSLADAIVASSLASSRASSPAKKVPAPPLPRRSSISRSMFLRRHSSETDLPRRVVSHQGMRQTLRKYPSDDNEDENSRRNHKHFMKHPNKHREGSRKRWKDNVTERERKRYEGVWAANKGIFLANPSSLPEQEVSLDTSTADLVLDLVVRDIWSRSQLPTDILAEIWDLVDRQGLGTLTRDEFVLGLWLIDQRLKGRKLPIRVSPTLWASVRHARGLNIPRKV